MGDDHEREPLVQQQQQHFRSRDCTNPCLGSVDQNEGRSRVRLRTGGRGKGRGRRRLYGGGRLDSGGDLSIWQVALGVSSDILSPAPLLIPHTFLLLGLPIAIPILFLTASLSWFSHVILVVCGRYVGGRTLTQIASAALPDRWRSFNTWFGEPVVEIFRIFLAVGRGCVNVMLVTDLFVQLIKPYTQNSSLIYLRLLIIVIVSIISSLPKLIMPRRPLFLPSSYPILSRLPLILVFFWPVSIVIIGLRLRELNRELDGKIPPPTGGGDGSEAITSGTIWGGFTILLFCLTTPQNTFKRMRSLRRVNKPPTTTHPMVPLNHSSLDPVSDPTMTGQSKSSPLSSYTLRRYSWEFATFLGVLSSSLICLCWGLVGYLGLDRGGFEVNFMASLPSSDPWITSARILLLMILFPAIADSLQPATTGVMNLIKLPLRLRRLSGGSRNRKRLNSNVSGSSRRRKLFKSEFAEEDDEEDDEEEEMVSRRVGVFRVVLVSIYIIVGLVAVVFGGSSGGESSLIQVVGCFGSSILTGLLPSLFFVALFHVRKARSILITDPSSRILIEDDLLLRKESQLQKKLSGRRIWQDLGVFGLLLPYCLVIFIKGTIIGIIRK
ncbi:hypothetical protein BY996DRAFT_7435117 [Phakopsora pachyrhizi]|uniref:Expressed protein n=1 Tax=Phakopsora pachyrhizi TaxID=170000 RepID=A0AAV0B943_PHAPC|nr:hypothetical protein BY996DRAFT_7435117 [Phakopsora pachyrhizi]CAH7682203.1 expressed protein [Phakopsora pachyrhizi]